MSLENKKLAHNIRKRVASTLPEKFAKVWEERMRRNSLEKEGWEAINDLVAFGVDDEHLHLHVHENLTKSRFGVARTMLEGLGLIAARLTSDSRLSPVRHIEIYSWIVYKRPDIIERFGFHISERDDIKKIALATMNKEDFIRRFSSEKQSDTL
ncbi:hypothetical protein FJY94_03330 [Candidatus Kaiserbacteria bacterium]|nr:hypothetical protein [Candidatus Kaiserbacteria bacterium]